MRKTSVSACLIAATLMAGAGSAQSGAASSPVPAAPGTANPSELAGSRDWLARHGVTYGLTYIAEVLGNVSGGVRRGALYEGKLEAFVAADLERLIGWRGLSFFGNAFQIHRTTGMRDDHFNSLITISNIEAVPSTRLSELWLEQKFFEDRFGIRFGQITADAEFFISDYSQMFMSSDWPTITGANLPGGGPAYPLATPGVRLRLDPNRSWSALLALFNGDPGEQGITNRNGTDFRIGDPPLLMGEIQFRTNQDQDDTGLARSLRLGAWHHFGTFDDYRLGTDGRSHAHPLSNGIARQFRGTSGIYGVLDQQLYRPQGGSADSGIGVFSRISASPSDHSFVNFYMDSGIVFSGMMPGRPDDKFGASVIYANISDPVRDLGRDAIAHSGIGRPIPDYELTVELSYQAQIRPGWTVQPTFQYVVHPGGNMPDPEMPARPVRNGALFGVRTTVSY